MPEGGVARWRLLPELEADGARQMATDEALLAGIAGRGAPPTLRLYRFSPATVSLGRHQRIDGSALSRLCAETGADLVRRPTGGGAVLHEPDSWTYAIAAPLGASFLGSSVGEVSCRLAKILRRALERLGIATALAAAGRPVTPEEATACFDRPSRDELLWQGRKIVGSAQARSRRAFLQHGVLPATVDPLRHARLLGASEGAARPAGLAEAAGRVLEEGEIRKALLAAFREGLGGPLEDGELGKEEARRIERRRAEVFLDASWTLEGRRREVPRGAGVGS